MNERILENKEECFAEARKYKNITELQKENFDLYRKIYKEGWLNEVKSEIFNMNDKNYRVYEFVFPEHKTTYIDRCISLNKITTPKVGFKNIKNISSRYIFHDFCKKYNDGVIPKHITLYKNLTKEEADEKVKEVIRERIKEGWKCIIDEEKYKVELFWNNLDKCKKTALLCSNKVELYSKYIDCYNACIRNNFQNEIVFKNGKKFSDDEDDEILVFEKSVIEDYVTNKLGVNDLCGKYHITNYTVHDIMNKYDVKVIGAGKHEYAPPKNLHEDSEGHKWVAICKVDGYKTYDIDNRGGFMSKHLKELNIEVPSLYKRKKEAKEKNVENWFEIYYDIKEEEFETKNCPYCDWKTKDVNNLSGAFRIHLMNAHGLTIQEHLKNHPEDAHYLKTDLNTLKNLQTETDESKFVVCQICGKKLRRIDWRHLEKHGITQEEYMLKYGKDSTLAEETKKKLAAIMDVVNQNMEHNFTSKSEIEILAYIHSLGFENAGKDRKILKGKELDILIPELNLAFEFNGVLWHTENFGKKDKNYHLTKTIECDENNIQLIHLFEDSYIFRKDVLFKKIKEFLNLPLDELKEIDDLSKLNFEVIDNDEIIKDFIEDNSLELFQYSDFYYVIKLDNEIICSLSLSKDEDDENTYIINQFCYNLNYNCKFLLFELLNSFIQEFKPIMIEGYLDRNFYSKDRSNFYNDFGFKYVSDTEPQSSYFSRNGVFRNRRVLFEDIERANLDFSDYDKIWNCGYLKYQLKLR